MPCCRHADPVRRVTAGRRSGHRRERSQVVRAVAKAGLPSAYVRGLAIACGLFADEVIARDTPPVKPPPQPAAVDFDTALLAERGVEPGVAAYFRHAPRFRPGRYPVHLLVNGRPRGSVHASFDEDGELLGDASFLEAAGLRPPVTGARDLPRVPQRFSVLFPDASIRQRPGQGRVELIMPVSALATPSQLRRGYADGGAAAVFNYDALAMATRFPGSTSRYRSLGTELGFNAGGWVVRSRQVFTVTQQQERREHLYAYAARTWEDIGAHIQFGQITMLSPLFAGGMITGVQVLPEAALQEAMVQQGGRVDGVALSPSRVEVRQNGALIHSAVVAPGPFHLTGVALLSQGIDLEVSVLGDDGQERRFTVPSAMLRGTSASSPAGYALTAGRVRPFGAIGYDMPLFAAASKDWVAIAGWRLTAGLLVGEGYRSAGLALQRPLFETVSIAAQRLVSYDQRGAGRGDHSQVMLSAALSSRWSLGLSLTQRTRGFRDLTDSAWPRDRAMPNFARRQYTGSVNWSMGSMGMVSGAYSRMSSYGLPTPSRMSLSWSTMLGGVTVALDAERALRGTEQGVRDHTVYFTLSIPLAPTRRLQAFVRDDGGRGQRHGLRLNEQVTESIAYGVGIERDDGRGSDVDLRVNLLPRVTQVDLGYAHRGNGVTSYRMAMRGGVVAHESGFTLSPYPIRDTLAVIDVGDLTGVKLRTPQGPVWTDGAGRAIAGQLPAYRNSRVEMDTASLPRHVDVGNGYKEIEAGRGSVQHMAFDVVARRRLLLTARMADGSAVPKGASVRDADDAYVTTVLADGKVFLEQALAGVKLHVVLGEDERCRLTFVLPEQAASHGFYETAVATCVSP
jgi:outer membrane usher protein FimD/PapC